MPLFTQMEPLLARLAAAVVAREEAEQALVAAARRLAAAPGSPAALRAMARAELLARRARLHVELAQRAVARRRGELLDDQRRVPAAFRRRRSPARSVEVVGAPAERPLRPAASSNGSNGSNGVVREPVSPRAAAGRALPS